MAWKCAGLAYLITSIIIIKFWTFAGFFNDIVNSITRNLARITFSYPWLTYRTWIMTRHANNIIFFPPKSINANTFIIFPSSSNIWNAVNALLWGINTFDTISIARFTFFVFITPKLIIQTFTKSSIVIYLKIKDSLTLSTKCGFILTGEAAWIANLAIIC